VRTPLALLGLVQRNRRPGYGADSPTFRLTVTGWGTLYPLPMAKLAYVSPRS